MVITIGSFVWAKICVLVILFYYIIIYTNGNYGLSHLPFPLRPQS